MRKILAIATAAALLLYINRRGLRDNMHTAIKTAQDNLDRAVSNYLTISRSATQYASSHDFERVEIEAWTKMQSALETLNIAKSVMCED